MNLLRFLFRASRRDFILAVLASLLGGGASVALMASIQKGLRESPASNAAASFAGLLLLILCCKILCQLILISMGQKAATRVRLQICRRVLATPLRQLERVGPAAILATLTEDVFNIAGIMWGLPEAFVSFCITISGLAYLTVLSTRFLVVIGTGVLLAGLTFYWLRLRALPVFVRARLDQDGLVRQFNGLVDGIKELQLNRPRREAFLNHALDPIALSYERNAIRGMQLASIALQWVSMFSFGIIGVLLFLPSLRQSLGSAMVRDAILAIFFLASPVVSLFSLLPAWTRTTVSLRKIDAMKLAEVQAPRVDAKAAAPRPEPASFQRLTLAGVTHAYRGARDEEGFILGPIDLVLERGELVFLVGGNGSGKTTLAKLLIGLYAAEQGAILIDAQELTPSTEDWYRSHFTAIFSTPFVFETILGRDGSGASARADEYLARLLLDHKVRAKDGVYSTVELSQGQRKRLALVTAYLEDRPIYVFDEWAADQDPSFKEIFYLELLPELKAKGKTILVITHDDRYFHLADRVLTLDGGKLLSIPVPPASSVTA